MAAAAPASEGAAAAESAAAPAPIVVPPRAASPAVEVSHFDTRTQEIHGGQEWSELKNYVEDFSLATNGLGTPKGALWEASLALQNVQHYPSADFEPARTALAQFLSLDHSTELRDLLLLGNGASELLDLVIRLTPRGMWKQGPWEPQYREFERAARAAGFAEWDGGKSNTTETLAAFCNPNNPTAEYMPVEDLKRYIMDNYSNNCTVVVDESMLPWRPDWKENSLCSQMKWITQMQEERNMKIFVLYTWTKIWACPGMRVGSLLCPTRADVSRIKKAAVPWSLNIMAVAFITEVVNDDKYMRQTWELTPQWRADFCRTLRHIFPQWNIKGEPWVSCIWVDVHSESVAKRACQVARECGCPIRFGGFGYRSPTHVRFAVRPPEKHRILLQAFRQSKDYILSGH